MLHTVETDQGTSATESCFTVDSDCSGLRVREVLLTCVDEPVDNFRGRSRSIREDHVVMSNTIVLKRVLVVLRVVQSYHPRYVQMTENLGVATGTVSITALLPLVTVDRSHEGDELARDNPIKISILDLLVMLVLPDIELIIVIPVVFESNLETFQRVEYCVLVIAFALASVSEGFQSCMVLGELVVRLVGFHVQNDHHESTHEEASVSKLGWVL